MCDVRIAYASHIAGETLNSGDFLIMNMQGKTALVTGASRGIGAGDRPRISAARNEKVVATGTRSAAVLEQVATEN